MLAKLTAKNQLTLPKAATQAVGAAHYFDVQTRDGQIILTPVRIQRSDAVRSKLAELSLGDADIQAAVDWARQGAKPVRVSEARAGYGTKHAQKKKSTAKPTGRK